MRSVGFVAGFLGIFGAFVAPARATPNAPAAEPHIERGANPTPAGEQQSVHFSADRLELDPELKRLRLDGHVVVAVDRYRLTGDRLELSKTPRGLFLTGPGRVALCPCPNPPVTFGFSSARVIPNTDLILEDPTLRVGGVPMLWLPYIWLRSPRRVGLLPLKVAWRGEDGLLLGSGVHVPVGETDALDLEAAGYVQGGVDVEGRLSTTASESAVRWDYLHESLLGVDLRGAATPVSGASLAWSVDALRGARALSGPVLLEEASLRQDRARGAIGTSDGKATLGLAVSADTARGGSLGTVGAVGPSVHAGYGSALGNVGTAGSDIEVATLHEPGVGSTTLVLHHGEVRADARAGAVLFDVQGRTRAVVTLGERDTGHTALAGVSGRISAPFVKRFGSSAAPLQHWITPSVVATIGAADTAVPSVAPALVPDGWFGIVMPGLSTAFGEVANGRSALTVSVQSGGMAERESDAKGFVAESSVADARLFAFHEEAVLMLGSPRSALHVFEARVGEVNGLFISAHLHESFGEPPLIARFAFSGLDAGWDAPWVPWFSAPGSTVGARVGVPWAPWLSNAVDVDYDVTNERLLGVRGSLRYLHPCGCLRVSLWGAERLGRSGVDSFLTVDLAEP